MSVEIGIKLGILKDKANFLSSSYKPNILLTNENFIVGRICLPRRIDNICVVNA